MFIAVILTLIRSTDCDIVDGRNVYQKDGTFLQEPESLPVLHLNDTKCRISEYQCFNKRCIPINRFCDGGNDCGDASDEPRHCTRKYSSISLNLVFNSCFIGYILRLAA